MARLLVRDLEPEIVQALKKRADQHGRSAEAEHREILKQALLGPKRKPFSQVLAEMPNTGLDTDFERIDDAEENSDLPLSFIKETLDAVEESEVGEVSEYRFE